MLLYDLQKRKLCGEILRFEELWHLVSELSLLVLLVLLLPFLSRNPNEPSINNSSSSATRMLLQKKYRATQMFRFQILVKLHETQKVQDCTLYATKISVDFWVSTFK